MNRMRGIALLCSVAVVVAFSLGAYVGVTNRLNNTASAQTQGSLGVTLFGSGGQQPSNTDFAKLWKAWNLLEEHYVQTKSSTTIPTSEEKVYGAIAGLTESYGDPYTVFMPPQEAKQFNEAIKGAFGGVGMELGQRDGLLTVVAPLKDSPAERAGMRSGDIVVAIDGKPSEKMAVEDAVALIRGEIGTSVSLTIKRAGVAETFKVTITRATINIPIINSYHRPDGIFVIELYSFSENSAELFRQALRKYFESGATQLLLDLRGNPGGYLEAAVQMASFFLPVGEVVVTEDYKGNQNNIAHRSVGYNVFANKKLSMAILIDEGSASASEILAGALSQQGVAKLFGARTFGKGSVQQLIELGGGAQIKITVARWLTPNGTNLSDGGITPDIVVARTVDDIKAGKDPQKEAAVAWFATQ